MVLAVLLWVAPASVQTDQHGTTYDLTLPPTRVTVVDFASAWYQPCWKLLPLLQALAARMPDVDVLVVSVDDKVDGRDQLVNRLGLTLPVIWDADHAIAEHFQPQAMPATFVLDAKGTIIFQYLGYDEETWGRFVHFLDRMQPSESTGR